MLRSLGIVFAEPALGFHADEDVAATGRVAAWLLDEVVAFFPAQVTVDERPQMAFELEGLDDQHGAFGADVFVGRDFLLAVEAE